MREQWLEAGQGRGGCRSGAVAIRRRRASQVALGCALLTGALGLAGCGNFFNPPASGSSGSGGSGSGGSGSGSGTLTGGDTFYIANANTSLNTLAAYNLASGKFASAAKSPYQLSVPPSTLAITPANTFVYAGSELGLIYVYAVNSDGSLTLGNSSGPVAQGVSPQSMVVDPTGKWLIALESSSNGQTIATVFAINTSKGTLTEQTPQVALDNGAARTLLFNPVGTVLYASLGAPISGSTTTSGGVDVLLFNPSTGALTLNANLQPTNAQYADIGLAINPAGTYLYVTETGINGVRSFSVGTNGSLSELAGSPTATGLGAGAVLVDATGSYLYVANSAASNISSFSIGANGALTSLGAPTATGTSPLALVEDNSKAYVGVVCSGGSPDFEIFKIDTTTPGVLDSFASITTGSVSPAEAAAIVATH